MSQPRVIKKDITYKKTIEANTEEELQFIHDYMHRKDVKEDLERDVEKTALNRARQLCNKAIDKARKLYEMSDEYVEAKIEKIENKPLSWKSRVKKWLWKAFNAFCKFMAILIIIIEIIILIAMVATLIYAIIHGVIPHATGFFPHGL